jgi:hypothetical protein
MAGPCGSINVKPHRLALLQGSSIGTHEAVASYGPRLPCVVHVETTSGSDPTLLSASDAQNTCVLGGIAVDRSLPSKL